MEGSADAAPSTFDYIHHEGRELLIVQQVHKFQPVTQGPFSEELLTHVVTIYVEEPTEQVET